jgi:hypothetical protein
MMNQGSPPANANAPAFDRGERKFDSGKSKPHATAESKDFENRRNAAACFANDKKREDWHDDFKGVAVVEGLRDGTKVWIGVRKRKTRDGREYLTVQLRPFRQRG